MAKGKKTGGGSRKGIPNKASAQKEAAIQASGVTPLEFMLGVLRDLEQPFNLRMAAAKEAAPYVHPKLATTVLKGDSDAPIALELKGSDVHG